MSVSKSHIFRIYPTPSAEDLSLVGSWTPHSAFVRLKDPFDQENPFDIVWVADGADPIAVAHGRLINIDDCAVIAVERARYNMFPSEVGTHLACASLMMSTTEGRDTIYVYDSSIETSACECTDLKTPHVLYDESDFHSTGKTPPMKVWSGGKVIWQEEVPERFQLFLKQRYVIALASYVYGRLRVAIEGRPPTTVPSEDVVAVANKSIDLFNRLTFGKTECYQHYFDCPLPEIVDERDAWILKHVAFQCFEPPKIDWVDEAVRLSNGIVRIWKTLCEANGILIQDNWEEDSLIECGYEFGVDFAIDSYLQGVALEYLLSGWDAKGKNYDDIPF